MDDEPARSKREDIEEFENPGRIHDPDIQCKYKFGDDAQSCFNDHVSLIMLLHPWCYKSATSSMHQCIAEWEAATGNLL